jgi:DNA modification methylase
VRLWSNPGETVLSPFAGIGSEGYVSLKHKRNFIGCELKPEYWRQGCKNLERATTEAGMLSLFDMLTIDAEMTV